MTPLHQFGDFCRELFLKVPLPWVRWVILLLLISLWIWVLFLPRSETKPPGRESRWDENLKLWASVALVVQIVIYSFV